MVSLLPKLPPEFLGLRRRKALERRRSALVMTGCSEKGPWKLESTSKPPVSATASATTA